jgi:hypothetical protein
MHAQLLVAGKFSEKTGIEMKYGHADGKPADKHAGLSPQYPGTGLGLLGHL